MDKYLKEVAAKVGSCGTIPEMRAAFKKKHSFSNLAFREQLEIWEFIWKNTDNYRIKTQAFFYCEMHANKKENAAHAWNKLKHWQNYVNDWPFCDGLSKIYTKHLELFPEEVFAQLKKWNTDKDLWKRRQSIVSLLYYERTKKVVLPYNKMLPLIDNLLHDDEYYVQKGVGWALRELHNAYPEKTFLYLQKNIKDISAIAFSSSREKLNAKQKNLLKALRK
jgi:3-methyladenine DNA glycosylase AlkD